MHPPKALCTFLIAIAPAWGSFLATDAAASIGTITIQPASPSIHDPVTITIDGSFPDDCWSVESHACGESSENTIGIGIRAVDRWDPTALCTEVVVPYERACTVGPLPAGHYAVFVTELHVSLRDPAPQVSLAEFDVFTNPPPDCGAVTAQPAELWPANGRLVPIALRGAVDTNGGPVPVVVTGVRQDEPVSGLDRRDNCPDATIANGTAMLRAERFKKGDGRVYVVSYAATDSRGATCTGEVRVCVPGRRGHGGSCAEGGSLANSLEPCAGVLAAGGEATVGPMPTDGAEDGQASGAEVADASLQALELAPGMVTVRYVLRAECEAHLGIYDVAGRRVSTLEDGPIGPGMHSIAWRPSGLRRGIYFLRFRACASMVSRAFLLSP